MKDYLKNLRPFLKKEHRVEKENRSILSENALLRYITFSFLYTAQGIPEGLIFFAIPAWLAMNGISPAEIGAFIGIIGIPWSFKIIAAPLMDRFSYLPMGRRRPWVMFGQIGLFTSLFCLSLVSDPLNNLNMLMVSGFFISFFGAFQDVAVDGMAIDIIPVHQQARANGLMWGSKTIGISLSLALSTYLINEFGFYYAPLTLSVAVTLIMLIPIFIRENPGEKILPWTKGRSSEKSKSMQVTNWGTIFKSLFKVFILPTSLLMGVAVFVVEMGFGLMEVVLPVFTVQEIGWSNSDYSNIMALANIVAGLLGMFVGGALIDFFGKIRMLSYYLVGLILIIATLAILKNYWNGVYFIRGFIVIYYILYTFASIAIFAIAMQLCWKRISATQFTLYMAIANLGRATGAGLLGTLKDYFDLWEYVILFIAVFALIMLFFIKKMNLKTHTFSLGILESNFLKN